MTNIDPISIFYINASNFERSEVFYDHVLVDVLGFEKDKFTQGDEPQIEYSNQHFGYVLRASRVQNTQNAYTPGFHHFGFRVDSKDEVTAISNQLQDLGIHTSEVNLYTDSTPHYWATFFTDPDDAHLEITNYRAERRSRVRH